MYNAYIQKELQTTWLDYPNNFSLAVIVYFHGCEFTCKECHNPYFRTLSEESISIDLPSFYKRIQKFCEDNKTDKVVFSGGDPLYTYNRDLVRQFLLDYGQVFDVCIYTGYSIEQVKRMSIQGFKFLKVGTFDSTKQQDSTKTDSEFRLASFNQELYGPNFGLLSKNGIYRFN